MVHVGIYCMAQRLRERNCELVACTHEKSGNAHLDIVDNPVLRQLHTMEFAMERIFMDRKFGFSQRL